MADDLQKPEIDLYERDYLAWTEVQASALRARKGGDNALDYENLAEEIEDLGKSEQRACERQVENILGHLLKIEFIGRVRRSRIGARKFLVSAANLPSDGRRRSTTG